MLYHLRSFYGFVFSFLFISGLFALTGAELTAFDAETLGRAGTDISIARGIAALNTNPAGITQTENKMFILGYGQIFPSVRYKNRHRSDSASSRISYIPQGWGGYLHNIDDHWYWGVGIVSLGGAISEFYLDQPYQHSLGDTSKIYNKSEIRVAKFIPAVAYKFNEELSVGLGLDIAGILFNLNTPRYMEGNPDLPTSYVYADIEDAVGYGFGFHAGLLYSPWERWTFGLTYQSPINFSDIETSSARVNMPFDPQTGRSGNDKYRARIYDFQWPQKVGFGASYQATDRLLLATDVKWINWKRAFKDLKVEFYDKKTNNAPSLPSEQKNVIPLDWKDQFVFSVAGEYLLTEKLTWRAGYNYGNNPIPSANTLPLMPLFTKHHIATGFSYEFNEYFQVNLGAEYALRETIHIRRSEVSPEFDNTRVKAGGIGVNMDFVFTF